MRKYMLLAWIGNHPVVLFSLDVAGHHIVATQGLCLLLAVVTVESFCYGLVTSGFVAFLMSHCNKRYSATQYALLSSVMGLTATIFPLAHRLSG